MCLSHLIYTVRPCLIHTSHAMPMPHPCRALTMPFFSRPRHSTDVERWPVGYLSAFGFFRLPRGLSRRLLSETYQSSSQRSIPTTVKSGSSTLQKKTICYTVGIAVQIFPATTRTFTKDTKLSEQDRGAAWHVWIKGTTWQDNGMGTAWAQHAMCESALRVTLLVNKFSTCYGIEAFVTAFATFRYLLLSWAK